MKKRRMTAAFLAAALGVTALTGCGGTGGSLSGTDGAGGARDNNIIHGKSFQKRRTHSTGIHSWIYRVYGINFFGT